VLQPFTVYEIMQVDGPRIPGIVFFCVSSENSTENINLNPREFSEYKWVTENQCKGFNMIPGIQNQAKQAFALAKQYFEEGKSEAINAHKT